MASPGMRQLQKTIALNDTIATAQAHVTGARKASIVCHWHEKDYHRMSGRIAAATQANSGDAPESSLSLGARSVRDVGIQNGIEAVKAMRRERLKELYEREALMYEQELHAMGLSLTKPRD